MISRWRKVFIKMGWLLTMITNPFEIPVIQNLKIFSFFIFHILFKIKHHPILRKKPNEKLFFSIFFRNSKYFLFWQESNFFRHKIYWHKNMKTFFFNFSYRKSRHMYLFYYQPAKEILEQGVPSRVLTPGNFCNGIWPYLKLDLDYYTYFGIGWL